MPLGAGILAHNAHGAAHHNYDVRVLHGNKVGRFVDLVLVVRRHLLKELPHCGNARVRTVGRTVAGALDDPDDIVVQLRQNVRDVAWEQTCQKDDASRGTQRSREKWKTLLLSLARLPRGHCGMRKRGGELGRGLTRSPEENVEQRTKRDATPCPKA